MRKELFLHFSFWFSFFVLATLFNRLFSWHYWPLWLGGVVGTLLPDIDDHISKYIDPQGLTPKKIFHTVFFQVIFLVLTFWVLTSSGSLFGKGLVLAFSLHLVIDQIRDLTELKSFDNWLKYSPVYLPLDKAKLYWLIIVLLIAFFGILL